MVSELNNNLAQRFKKVYVGAGVEAEIPLEAESSYLLTTISGVDSYSCAYIVTVLNTAVTTLLMPIKTANNVTVTAGPAKVKLKPAAFGINYTITKLN